MFDKDRFLKSIGKLFLIILSLTIIAFTGTYLEKNIFNPPYYSYIWFNAGTLYCWIFIKIDKW